MSMELNKANECTCPSGDGSLVHPCPAHPAVEQAEAERPEVVAYADPVAFATFKERGHEGGVAGREWMWAEPGAALVAMSRTDECERIVGALREQYECNTAIMHARTEALSRVTSERDAALSRVAELEKQEPVATVAKVPGEDWNSLDFHRDLQDMQPGTKLYAAPVAQAQHSVPEEFIGRLSEFLAQRGTTGKALLRELRAMLAAAPVCRLSRSALTDAQMRRLYDSSTETENERLGFAAFARLIRRAEAVHQIAAAPGKEGV